MTKTTYHDMVIDALIATKKPFGHSTSRQAIVNYLSANYDLDVQENRIKSRIKKALDTLIGEGIVEKIKPQAYKLSKGIVSTEHTKSPAKKAEKKERTRKEKPEIEKMTKNKKSRSPTSVAKASSSPKAKSKPKAKAKATKKSSSAAGAGAGAATSGTESEGEMSEGEDGGGDEAVVKMDENISDNE